MACPANAAIKMNVKAALDVSQTDDDQAEAVATACDLLGFWEATPLRGQAFSPFTMPQ